MAIRNASLNGITRLERLFQFIAGAFMFILILITVANIIARSFYISIPGVIEVSVLLLVFGIYLGLPYAQSQRSHVRMMLVVNLLKGKKRHIIEIVALFVALAILVPMFWRTGVEGLTAFQIKTYEPGLIPFPTWPSKLVIPLGLLFFMIRILVQIVEELNHLKVSDNLEKDGRGKL